ncbi:unnamed protein product [Heterobilharzia americana]|nr:unnamed protein product [Heterobilharzia americana]
MPNLSETVSSNYLNELSMKTELISAFPNFSALTNIPSSLSSSLEQPTTSGNPAESSSGQSNILNNLLCICGIRFDEVSTYLSHITSCNYLKNLVQQQLPPPRLSRSDDCLTPSSSSSSSSVASPPPVPLQLPQIVSQLPPERQPTSTSFLPTFPHFQASLPHLFPFNFSIPPLSSINQFSFQNEVLNNTKKSSVDIKGVDGSADCLLTGGNIHPLHQDNSDAMNRMAMMKSSCSPLNDMKLPGVRSEPMEYEELNNCKDLTKLNQSHPKEDDSSSSSVQIKTQNKQSKSPKNVSVNNPDDRGDHCFEYTSVFNLTKSTPGRNQSPVDEYNPENNTLSGDSCHDDKVNMHSSNSPFVTAMASVLANAAAAAGFHCPGLQDFAYRKLAIQQCSSPETPAPSTSTSSAVESVEITASERYSERNKSDDSPDDSMPVSMITGNSPKSCYQCGKEFSSRLSLKQHVEAVREQSPISSDIINNLSLSGTEDNSSPSSLHSPDPSANPIEQYATEDRDLDENVSNDVDDDELQRSFNNSPSRHTFKREVLQFSKISRQTSNSMEESHLSRNSDPNDSRPIPSKLTKQRILNKHQKTCQNLKEDSSLCDIKAFPVSYHSFTLIFIYCGM